MKTDSQRKYILIVVVLVLAIGGIVGYVAWSVWSARQQKTNIPATVPSLSETASRSKQAGVAAEASGENKKALESYQSAQEAYEKAGDKAAAEDMRFKVEFIKNAIEADKKATQDAVKNGDAPYNE